MSIKTQESKELDEDISFNKTPSRLSPEDRINVNNFLGFEGLLLSYLTESYRNFETSFQNSNKFSNRELKSRIPTQILH